MAATRAAHCLTPYKVGTSECGLLESDKAGHEKRHPIQIVLASDVAGSPAKFYELAAGLPIIDSSWTKSTIGPGP